MNNSTFDKPTAPITAEEIAEWRAWFAASPYAQTGILEILDLATSTLRKRQLPVIGLDMDAIYKNPKYAHLRRVA